MKKLRACFVGIGSIAKRHIKNFYQVCQTNKIELEVDAFRRTKTMVEGINMVYTDIKQVPNNYDVVFITNPTELHLDSLIKFHDKGKHFFIEKPVVSLRQIENAKTFKIRRDSVYYVACPLRYNAVIQYIKSNVNTDSVLSVRAISSSYLPDWRTGQDYRNSYSAHKELGGGVDIDLIHEWDYLTYIFGFPKEIQSMIGKISNLEIDSNDYAIYIADFGKKIVELHLDYFGLKTIREVMLFTKNDTIIGDLVNNKIEYLKSGRTIDFKEERDDYQKRELLSFINMIRGNTTTEDGYHQGLKVLEFTQGKV